MGRAKATCRHCGIRPSCRPKRLCWRCYYNQTINSLYVALPSRGSNALVGVGEYHRPLPADPCPFAPGTEGKIRAMEIRAARQQQLHHPDDFQREPKEFGA